MNVAGKNTILAWSTNNKKSISAIYLSDLAPTDPKLKDYAGNDEYAIVETTLVRRFPIPGNKHRQLEYKLHQGEAGWILKLEKSSEF